MQSTGAWTGNHEWGKGKVIDQLLSYIDELEAGIKEAAEVFEEYGRHHDSKRTLEGRVKAGWNYGHAAKLRKLIEEEK